MNVAEGRQVSIEYTLTLEDKEVVDTNVGGQPLTFVQGQQQIIPGLEKALEGMAVGDSKQVTIAAEEGYGPVLQDAIIEVAQQQLPEDAREVGAHIQGQTPQGVVRGQIIEMKDDVAIIDFNHPLAGKTLYFDVKILAIQ